MVLGRISRVYCFEIFIFIHFRSWNRVVLLDVLVEVVPAETLGILFSIPSFYFITVSFSWRCFLNCRYFADCLKPKSLWNMLTIHLENKLQIVLASLLSSPEIQVNSIQNSFKKYLEHLLVPVAGDIWNQIRYGPCCLGAQSLTWRNRLTWNV